MLLQVFSTTRHQLHCLLHFGALQQHPDFGISNQFLEHFWIHLSWQALTACRVIGQHGSSSFQVFVLDLQCFFVKEGLLEL
jgi:hypothetical protein